jgi:hypothetical protein
VAVVAVVIGVAMGMLVVVVMVAGWLLLLGVARAAVVVGWVEAPEQPTGQWWHPSWAHRPWLC